MSQLIPQTPRRILLVRLSAIGDIIMATPLIQAFRRTYPDARLTWLVQPEARDVLAANPALDEVMVWPRAEWSRLWRERRYLTLTRAFAGFVRELRARRFDLAVDIQGLMKSALWVRLSGAPQRIGLDSREGSDRLMTAVVRAPGGSKHIGAEYRHLARTLELDSGAFDMDIALSPEDEAFAARFRSEHGLEARYAVLCPFTTRPQKHWVEDRWPALAVRLHRELGLDCVLLGGPRDAEAGARIAGAAAGRIASAAGATSLRQAAALIRDAALLVGVDTGLTHAGIAFGVPTLALFGSTCPYLHTGRDNARVLYHKLDCSPCKRNPTCGGAYTCMRALTVDEIVANAGQLLGTP
jgi:heptosyltransferase-1